MFAALLLALVLPALVAGPAAADDYEQPRVIPSVPGLDPERGEVPGGIIVRWWHSGDGVWDFSVERESPNWVWHNVNATQRNLR